MCGLKMCGFFAWAYRWDSNFIPRFTKMFEYWNIFSAIVFGIKNSAFPRNLSPWAYSRAEKTHPTIQILRVGEVPFKISFLKNAWYHRNQRLTEQWPSNFGKNSSIFLVVFQWDQTVFEKSLLNPVVI